MKKHPISGNGYKKVKINLGTLNCFEEPYFLTVGKKKMILRFKWSARENDHGVITLEDAN